MAKTKRQQKSTQELFSEQLKTRIISAIGIFLVIIAALDLGFVGKQLSLSFRFLFGNFTGVIYAIFIILGCYIIYKAKLPKFNGPKAVSIYFILFSVLLFISLPSDSSFQGLGVISQYAKDAPMNQGGFIGAICYGICSALFDYMGTIIAAGFILTAGLILLGSKLYIEYKRQHKTKETPKIKEKQNDNTITIKVQSRKLRDLFGLRKNKIFFSEEVFEDPKPKIKKASTIDKKVYQSDLNEETNIHMEADSFPPKVKEKRPVKQSKPKTSKKEVVAPIKNETIKTDKNYQLPPLSLLNSAPNKKTGDNRNYAVDSAQRLTTVLNEFGVKATISDIFIGPTVTKYELKLETGVRVNKILQLQDDIKLALATKDIRIEAPIPGKPAVGIEIPNLSASTVSFKELFQDIPENKKDNKLLVALGKNVSGKPIYAELDKMPHLLIAGATGSGKSVCINTIICSILMRATPDEVKLILVDPKKVELSSYNGIPHLLAPVVTDAKKAAMTLREVVSEMENRYELFAKYNVRNISGFNRFAKDYNKDKSEEDQLEIMSYQVVVLDEVADLMLVASKDVEDCIMRIAQMARAAGIHLIVATQRPSTDVITGVIKANIPSRIAFAVSSSVDSRTILDATGAERLLGKGDMLFSPMGSSSPTRIQGAFVSDAEVEAITYFVSQQQSASYDEKFVNVKSSLPSSQAKEEAEDEEYEMCRTFVINAQKASTSLLQRQFRIGYNKAARIIDRLEAEGVIGPQIGSKPREVYIRGYEEF